MGILKCILDYFYPTYCLICLEKGFYICNECLKKLSYYNGPCCPVCKGVLRSNKYFIHKLCQMHSSLDGLFPLLHYDEKAKLILGEAKFKFARDILKEMAVMLKQLYANLPFKIDYLVPVPLSKERMNFRGFNQSEILARGINWKYKNILIKTRHTVPQAKSKRSQRISNLVDAFGIDSRFPIKNKNIVLVDDVCTTGSTLQECAKVLKNAGANKVVAIVWAKD